MATAALLRITNSSQTSRQTVSCHNYTHHHSQQHRYSIASLARASNVCGTLRPSALAVVRLIRSAMRVSGKCRSTSLRRLLGQTSLKGHSFFQFDDIGVTSAYPNRMLAFKLILDQRGMLIKIARDNPPNDNVEELQRAIWSLVKRE